MFELVVGLTRLSLVDYPGVPSAVLFYGYCNLRCPYCHNSELVLDPPNPLPDRAIEQWLVDNKGKGLDGVVLTGGEPLAQGLALLDDMRWLHRQGFSVKLDTNGLLYKDVLFETQLLAYADYVALDYKLPLERYGELYPGEPVEIGGLRKMIRYLDVSRQPSQYELRTTVCPALLKFEDLEQMAEGIPRNRWWLQQFRGGNTLSSKVADIEPYPDSTLVEWARELGCNVRGVGEAVE